MAMDYEQTKRRDDFLNTLDLAIKDALDRFAEGRPDEAIPLLRTTLDAFNSDKTNHSFHGAAEMLSVLLSVCAVCLNKANDDDRALYQDITLARLEVISKERA